MSLQPGTRLGPYEISSLLGAGGMGEVYRARDPRLNREVAIKVLPAGFTRDADRLQRFQQEARAAGALNHPGIMAVLDLGEHEGTPYLVCELLEGRSLREVLKDGPVPPRRAAEMAAEVARALAAAHEHGLVHRDLKPDNLFVLKSGTVKILDFGLAKLRAPAPGQDEPTRSLMGSGTAEGVILGTAGYMSPEQVRGQAVDARSDLFSLGVVLYEMVSGEQPFKGSSAVEVLNAILKEDPPELPASGRAHIPPGLDRILRHALEKEPERRFQNARDFAFDLENLSQSSGAGSAAGTSSRRRRLRFIPLAAVLLAAGGALGWITAGSAGGPAACRFKRLTFGKGTVETARFTPGSPEILYSARWQGQGPEIFAIHPDNLQPRTLDIQDATLLSVSSTQELAVMPGPRLWNNVQLGPLDRVVPGSSGMREVLPLIQEADWLPGGGGLAVLKGGLTTALNRTVEFPLGHALRESSFFASNLRVSRKGDRIVLFERLLGGTDHILLLDRAGHATELAHPDHFSGLAWGPGDREVWYSEAWDNGSRLWAVDLSGHRRLLLSQAGWLSLADVDADGRALAILSQTITGVMGLFPPDYRERDLSWNEASRATDFTPDGSALLIGAPGVWAASEGRSFYLRKTDGSRPVRLGEAAAFSLLRDGRHVLSLSNAGGDDLHLSLIPVGSGESRTLTVHGLDFVDGPWPFPDGKRAVIAGAEHGKRQGFYQIDLATGGWSRIGPENAGNYLGAKVLSPDGKSLVWGYSSGNPLNMRLSIFPLEGGPSRPLPTEPGDIELDWTPDGKGFLVFNRDGLPVKIHRIDVATGRRDLVREILPANPAGLSGVREIVLAPDGKALAYNYVRKLSDLYLIEGLK